LPTASIVAWTAAKSAATAARHVEIGPNMFIGIGIFAVVAILCVIAGAAVMKRNRAYGKSGSKDDDFDFDKYEGFDK